MVIGVVKCSSPDEIRYLARFRAQVPMELSAEEHCEHVSAGSVASATTGDDVGLRAEVVDSLASVASEVLGAQGVLPGAASC